ncbi:MAG: ABC transporter ATP-binding protein [Capsulimonadaceae bacterium]
MLEIKNLEVFYGAIRALHGVTLSIEEGSIVTLIGANGAGKTTILRTISGLVRAAAGRITFAGEEITWLPAADIVRRGIGHSPEGRRIFANMSVRENLDLGAYARKDGAGIREDMDRVFTLFPRLKERFGQNAGTLSGGEQQMLAMGRALMGRPKLLLLDEPSLGLAPFLVRDIFAIIKDINKQGTTILLVEQNAHMALAIAHHGYVLESGEMTLSASAADLLTDDKVKKAYLGE